MSLPLEGVILSLQDLIFYFLPPDEELEHEEKQTKLRSLRNRQNLFQEEVIFPHDVLLLSVLWACSLFLIVPHNTCCFIKQLQS